MRKIKSFFAVVALLLIGTVAFAQTQVSGSVKESSGEAVSGAAVQLKGSTTVYAMTDASGSYTISVPADGTLVFSCLGYKPVEIPVGGKKVVDVILESDSQLLEETIVVAYGTVKREAVTGSVSSVKGETLTAAPVTSVDKALAGKLAGVSVSASTGQPGALTQIRIRGNGSINANNAPLWVVDGIPVLSGDFSLESNQSSAMTALNPNDIENITVLKDAAAAAAYGSRAANGVILVTTKSGKEGRTQFNVRAKYGINWLQPDNGFRMMTASELLGWQRDAIRNAGGDPDDPSAGGYYRPLSLLQGKLYNPLHEFTRLGNTQEYEIGANGGNSRSRYYSSFSYQKDEGVFYGVDFQRLQGRINSSYKLLDNLETGVRFNIAYTDQRDVPMASLARTNPVWAGETILPWLPLTDENGKHVANPAVNSGENPRATAENDDKYDRTFHLNGTVNLKWTPIKNLDIETRNSMESFFVQSRYYFSPLAHQAPYAYQLETQNAQILQLTTSNTITYQNIFGGYHNVRALVGQEAMSYSSYSNLQYSPEVSDAIPYHNSADQSQTEIKESISEETMLSFFGIFDYNYDNRYFVQANVRADGSSLFGADKKWGVFWSASASWNITNEAFMRGLRNINLLKFRVSYGVNGNNGIAAYRAYGLYGTSIYNGVTGFRPTQLENRVLSWERNLTSNVGLDFAFFNNRLSGSIDVYERLTKDLLLTKQIPQTSGFSSIFSNVGSMVNDGIEVQLDYNIIQKPDFVWSIGGNAAFNKTCILDLGGDDYINANDGGDIRYVVGKSLRTFYLADYYGVNPTNGEALWVSSINEETGEKTLTNDYAKARYYYAGSPEPKVVGGFNTVLQWKGLSFSAFFEGKAGHKVLIWNENHYLVSDGKQMSMNQFASALNYWKKPGDVGVHPKPVAGNTSNSNDWSIDRYLENASYLRLKDVTLSYTFPQTLTRKIKIDNLRLYVSGLNLYCFNDVNFWDPEQGVTGITAGTYPITKAVVGGIELTF